MKIGQIDRINQTGSLSGFIFKLFKIYDIPHNILTKYGNGKNTVVKINNKKDFYTMEKGIKTSLIDLNKEVIFKKTEIKLANGEKLTLDLSEKDEEIEIIFREGLSLSSIIINGTKKLLDLFNKNN